MTRDRHRFKKRFGQNFLHERKYIDDIVAAAGLDESSRVFEIGPGLGALTDRMLPLAAEVHIAEVDTELIEIYRQRPEKNLVLHAGDALQMDWRQLLPKPPYRFVANLPYNISSQVLIRLIAERDLFSRAVLMFQREVAERISAAPGTREYGSLSVFCQVYFDIDKVVIVPPGAFRPAPKVDSAVIRLEPLPQPRCRIDDEAFFRRVVRAAFAQRRKTLRNTLKSGGFEPEQIEAACRKCDIDPGRRGETLTLQEFCGLTLELAAAR